MHSKECHGFHVLKAMVTFTSRTTFIIYSTKVTIVVESITINKEKLSV